MSALTPEQRAEWRRDATEGDPGHSKGWEWSLLDRRILALLDALARVEAVLAAEEERVEAANAQFEAEGRVSRVTGRPFRILTIVGAEAIRDAIAGGAS